MAITWRGAIATPPLYGTGGTVMFALVNTFRSRCNVHIRRLILQMETPEHGVSPVTNAIMPLIRAVRCAASSVGGGYPVTGRMALDTTVNAADAGVLALYNPMLFSDPSGSINITPGGRLWQRFTSRQVTASGQVVTWNFAMLPTGDQLILRVGEALALEWSNNPSNFNVGGIAFINAAWEEDQVDAGYSLSGQVTLNAVGVDGARVILLTDNNRNMPTPAAEVILTSGGGNWSRLLASGVKAAAFVQHDASGTLYTDEGKPYLEKP